MRTIYILLLALLPAFCVAQGQPTSTSSDVIVAKNYLRLHGDTLNQVVRAISNASTHYQTPTAKAVYLFCQQFLSFVFHDNTLSGNGTFASPLTIAQNGATQNQVLTWTHDGWVPAGENFYEVKTSTGSANAYVDQVLIGTLSAGITLTLPTCNAAFDSKKYEFWKNGSDAYPVTIDPTGSETFSDGASIKKIYSPATGLSCTCRWNGSVGAWYFISM